MMKQEPAADVRVASKAMREWFEALCEVGFSEYQALIVIGTMLGTMGAQSPRDIAPRRVEK